MNSEDQEQLSLNEILLRAFNQRAFLNNELEILKNKLLDIDDRSIQKRALIRISEIKQEIENLNQEYIKLGLPIPDGESILKYEKLNEHLNSIKNSEDLLDWVMNLIVEDQKVEMQEQLSIGKTINMTSTGKWQGKFIPSNPSIPAGEFTLGACQIGNRVYGYGVFIDSIYSEVSIDGICDHEEIRAEIIGNNIPYKTFYSGKIKTSPNGHENIAGGNYFIQGGIGDGVMEAKIIQSKLQLSKKSKRLIELSHIRNALAHTHFSELASLLDRIKEKNYLDEVIVFKSRLRKIAKNKRLGVYSFSEIQLEETRVATGILEMISEIEGNYRKGLI